MNRMFSVFVLSFFACVIAAGAADTALLVVDPRPGAAVRHGLTKMEQAVRAKGISYRQRTGLRNFRNGPIIVAGLGNGPGAAATLIRELGITAPAKPESLLIRHAEWRGANVLLVSGADDCGLMYALLDVAGRIGWAQDAAEPLSEVRNIEESPEVAERGLSIYTMHKARFESFFYDEAYWASYLDMLAKDRFNTFSLLFGYESSGYLAPAFPPFFDTEGFPQVKAAGVTPGQQQRNVKALNRLIEMAHERGLNFTLGLWDHIYRGGHYTDGVWDYLEVEPVDGKKLPVSGVTKENLSAYSKAALVKFLRLVPNIDTIQFRMHGESGLTRVEMKQYWRDIYAVMKEHAPTIRFDARAEGYPDDLIEDALETKLNFRVATKYWAEQMGMPFHPTHTQRRNQFDRRHGYADLLRYPQTYKMLWRLWTSATSRILLWGDPDYVRRFVASTHLYDGEGFEVTEPLATKMASRPHNEKPFHLLAPAHQYYEYEFERYWHFFQLFGRLGYNPGASAEIWDREFQRRFGKEAAPFVQQGLQRASQILPRIVASSLPPDKFPATRGWAEKQRWGDVWQYAKATPSDTQQFLSIGEAAALHLEGGESAKIHPLETADWFARAADDVLKLAGEAEARAAAGDGAERGAKSDTERGTEHNREFRSTMIDLRILANLARYHCERGRAAYHWALFKKSNDVSALDVSIQHEALALAAWGNIVEAAGEVYAENLMFGRETDQRGWSVDLTGHWKTELIELQRGLQELKNLRQVFEPGRWPVVGRFDFEGTRDARYQRVELRNSFSIDLPNGNYELRFGVGNPLPDSPSYGPMWIEANGVDRTDTFIVAPGTSEGRRIATTVTDNKLNVAFKSTTAGRWHLSSLSVLGAGPRIAHSPVRRIKPGEDFTLGATISGDAPIARVRVGYENDGRGFQYREFEKLDRLVFRTVMPGVAKPGKMSYFIEAVDEQGRRVTYPPGGGTSLATIIVSNDREAPTLSHEPIEHAQPGEPLTVRTEVRDASGVKWVRLRYRGVTQHQDFHTLAMLPTGRPNEYEATVPGTHLDPQWNFMYLIEVMDEAGNGKIHPDLNKETPYVIVDLQRQPTTPTGGP